PRRPAPATRSSPRPRRACGRASRRSISRRSATSWRRSSRASGSPWTSSTDPDHVEEILMRRLTALLPVAIALALLWSAPTRAQSRGKEIVVGLGAEQIGEHTSELQSRENLVCRLLLEKKKKKKHTEH